LRLVRASLSTTLLRWSPSSALGSKSSVVTYATLSPDISPDCQQIPCNASVPGDRPDQLVRERLDSNFGPALSRHSRSARSRRRSNGEHEVGSQVPVACDQKLSHFGERVHAAMQGGIDQCAASSCRTVFSRLHSSVECCRRVEEEVNVERRAGPRCRGRRRTTHARLVSGDSRELTSRRLCGVVKPGHRGDGEGGPEPNVGLATDAAELGWRTATASGGVGVDDPCDAIDWDLARPCTRLAALEDTASGIGLRRRGLAGTCPSYQRALFEPPSTRPVGAPPRFRAGCRPAALPADRGSPGVAAPT
jgi:hypothetical protein